jgi:hypothetical protein
MQNTATAERPEFFQKIPARYDSSCRLFQFVAATYSVANLLPPAEADRLCPETWREMYFL